jgi:hypothetical protein
MGFADHGIPANSAEFLGNGAGGMALLPKGLQHLDTFGRPDHIHCGTLNMLWASHYAPTRGSEQEENRGNRAKRNGMPARSELAPCFKCKARAVGAG